MLLAAVVSKSSFVDLSAYPRWLVIAVGVVVAVVLVWVFVKVLKWTLWLFLAAIVAAGVVWLGWQLLH